MGQLEVSLFIWKWKLLKTILVEKKTIAGLVVIIIIATHHTGHPHRGESPVAACAHIPTSVCRSYRLCRCCHICCVLSEILCSRCNRQWMHAIWKCLFSPEYTMLCSTLFLKIYTSPYKGTVSHLLACGHAWSEKAQLLTLHSTSPHSYLLHSKKCAP